MHPFSASEAQERIRIEGKARDEAADHGSGPRSRLIKKTCDDIFRSTEHKTSPFGD